MPCPGRQGDIHVEVGSRSDADRWVGMLTALAGGLLGVGHLRHGGIQDAGQDRRAGPGVRDDRPCEGQVGVPMQWSCLPWVILPAVPEALPPKGSCVARLISVAISHLLSVRLSAPLRPDNPYTKVLGPEQSLGGTCAVVRGARDPWE